MRTQIKVLTVVAAAGILASACGGGTGEKTAPTASARAAAAESAKPSGTPSGISANATPTPRPMELTGKFAISPQRGPLGTAVTATATGLKPQSKYDVVWTTVNGSWKLNEDGTSYLGRQFTPVDVPMQSVTTDAAGAFAITFKVPAQDFGFQHDVLVLDGAKIIRNKSGFAVDLDITITPKSGPVGTPITIEAKGVGWRDFEGAWMAAYDNVATGLLSGVTTKGYAKAVIPAAGGLGTHIITVLSGDLNFMYLNMQQSPSPDRPQFHLPFTVTDGPAVMPAPIEQQRVPVMAAQPVDKGIYVSPKSGIVGSSATLIGKGLPANTDLDLTYLAQVGNRVTTGAYTEQGKPLGKARTDANGNLSWSFAMPDDLGGDHRLLARNGNVLVAESVFVVQPNAFALSTDRGPSGTIVKIHVKGVGWTETANFYALNYDNGYMGYACGFNSSGDIEINLAMSGVPGWHYVELYPGIYKGTESRPLNFRIPQLTAAADHPGENLPIFRFAFLVTAP